MKSESVSETVEVGWSEVAHHIQTVFQASRKSKASACRSGLGSKTEGRAPHREALRCAQGDWELRSGVKDLAEIDLQGSEQERAGVREGGQAPC